MVDKNTEENQHLIEIIGGEMTKQFFTIERELNETWRDFVFRTWRTANPNLPEHLYQVGQWQFSDEVVWEGYLSPYRFGIKLREMVGGANDGTSRCVPIFAAKQANDRGVIDRTVYYCWDEPDIDGPHVAAFYAPYLGPTFGNPDGLTVR